MPEVSNVVNVTSATFARDVVERSRQVPVVIDFWAPWCGPCRTLGPILEKIAQESAGAFVLAKIDTDQNPEVAQYFQVSGIPAVMVIKNAQLLDGFTGALPEREVRAFLEKLFPLKKADPLAAVKELEAAGDRAGAIKLLRQLLRDHSELTDARIELARLLVADGKSAEARLVLEKLDEAARATSAAQAVLAQLQLGEQAGQLDGARAAYEANPADLGARIRFARALLGARRWEEGLDHLLEAVALDPRFQDGAARKAMLEAFEALGADHPTTVDYRFRLQMVLLV